MPGTETLFAAIESGDAPGLGRLLADDPALATARHASGASALMYALYLRKPEIAERLRSALPALDVFEAAALGDLTELERCIAADPACVRAWSPDGFTALHFASFLARPQAAARLIAAGAEVGAAARNAMQVQPLHSAVSARANDIAAMLLAAGAPPDAAQHQGWTALMSAAMHGDAELAALLLTHGARRDPRDDAGRTAHDLALEKGFTELAVRLRP